MERWQAVRLKRARDDVRAFIQRLLEERDRIDRQLVEARKLLLQFSSLDDFLSPAQQERS